MGPTPFTCRSNVVCPYFFRPSSSILSSYLSMHSFTVSTSCTKGCSASPTSTGIASFTFSAKLGLEQRGSRAPILFTSPRVVLINSVRTDTNASRARSTTRSWRTSRLRCRIGNTDCGSPRPNRANLFASMRSLLRLRRFDPSINRGLATSTSCPHSVITSCTQAECVPTSTTTRAVVNPRKNSPTSSCVAPNVPRPSFSPPNPKCSTDSSGLPDPPPPSDDLDWGQTCFPCHLFCRSPTPPLHPGLLSRSTFSAPPPSLPSHLAALDLVTSLASRLLHSAGKTCYASSRS